MIGCGIATMISALGLGFIGPRLPIVMGVFYIFIGPIVAISKDVSLAAAMTALMIGGLVQFAWSPLIGKLHRFFPPIVTGTTILLIGTGLMKIGINVASGVEHAGVREAAHAVGLAALMIVLIIVINRFTQGFVNALSLFLTMVIGYLVSAAFGLINLTSVAKRAGSTVPSLFPYGGLEWPGLIAVITVVVCFFATAVETTGHTLAVSRIAACRRRAGASAARWRTTAWARRISALFGGMALTSYSQNIGVISLTGVGSRFVVAFGGAFLIIMALVPKVGAIIALMPNAVLGGVLLFMFGMVASVGIDIIGRNLTSRRDAVILAASLAVGLGIQARRRAPSRRSRRRCESW